MNKAGNKNTAEDYIESGNAFYFQQKFEEAIKNYEEALKINPHQVVALTNLGTIYAALDQLDKALEYSKKAVRLAPKFSDSLRNLGFLYQKMKLFDKSLPIFQKAIKLNPKDLDALKGKIIGLKELGKLGRELKKTLHQIRVLKISDFDLLYNLGNLAARANFAPEAAYFYETAVKIKPDSIPCYASLTLIYTFLRRKDKKLRSFQKIVKIDPTSVWAIWAYNQMALLYLQQFKYRKTIFYLKECLRLVPSFTKTYSNLLLAYRQGCFWKEAERIEKNPDFLNSEDPMISVIRCEDSKQNYQTAQKAILEIIQNTKPVNFAYSSPRKKIRLGYLSADLRNHPIGHLVASLFGLHDRKHFEVYVYSCGIDDKSYWRKRPKSEADQFSDVSLLKPAECAKLINDDRIDILIDLTGFTLGQRIEVCALHPSPIQVSFLGFPSTSGAPFMDYMFVDKIVASADDQKNFAEKLVFLPDCYQVNDFEQKISSKKFKRETFGLPATQSMVFSSFNQSFKIEPVMFDVWMEILKEVPGSVLWLMHQGEELSRNLKKEARNLGVEPHRLIFSKALPNPEHLKRLQLADIALDTRIYGGHTTTSDCLRAGVPVITIKGSHFASRVAASILTTYGIPELVINSLDEYKNLAINLAKNKDKLNELRDKIKVLRPGNPLFDTKRFAGNLEKAYVKMWQTYLAGGQPEGFEVKE